MTSQNLNMAEVASLIGDPARANMLAALMDGRALTATELAFIARVAPQTASGHLGKLAATRLLTLEKQGRHRYYRLASPLVGHMLEGIMAVAAMQVPPRHRPLSRLDEEMQAARTCYDHLAGRLAVGLADALLRRDYVALAEDGGELTEAGAAFLEEFGAKLPTRKRSQRAFCRPCLDWSERRWHIAGAVGGALCDRCFELGWIERRSSTRAVKITEAGQAGFSNLFGLDLPGKTEPPYRP
ncbi:MAG: ArsR/SmtB family transcription factor [Beijerinckiaceae bacterium]